MDNSGSGSTVTGLTYTGNTITMDISDTSIEIFTFYIRGAFTDDDSNFAYSEQMNYKIVRVVAPTIADHTFSTDPPHVYDFTGSFTINHDLTFDSFGISS